MKVELSYTQQHNDQEGPQHRDIHRRSSVPAAGGILSGTHRGRHRVVLAFCQALVALIALAAAATASAAPTRAGYCVGGTFLNLEIGQNESDPAWSWMKPVPAFEIKETGALTCTPGFRTLEFDGIYPIIVLHAAIGVGSIATPQPAPR